MADHDHASAHAAGDAAHGHSHDHGSHGHSHGHDHNVIPWTAFRTNRVLQGVLGIIVVAAVATIALLVTLWPGDDATAEAVSQGAQVGLGSDRYAATVTDVTDRACSYSTRENRQECRVVSFMVDEGPFEGQQFAFGEFNLVNDALTPDVVVGDAIIAGHEPSTDFWFYADRDRRTMLVALAVVFALFVVALGRLRGLAALVGMAITVAVLVWFVAPSVLQGNDPLVVAVVAAAAIAFVSLGRLAAQSAARRSSADRDRAGRCDEPHASHHHRRSAPATAESLQREADRGAGQRDRVGERPSALQSSDGHPARRLPGRCAPVMNVWRDIVDAFEAERERLFGIAYRMTGSVMDAEDIVQETWVRVTQAIDHGPMPDNLAAYATTACAHLSLDRLKSAEKRRVQYVGP